MHHTIKRKRSQQGLKQPTANSSSSARASGSMPNSSANILCTGYMSCLKRIPSSTGYEIAVTSWTFRAKFGDRRYLRREKDENNDATLKCAHSSMLDTTRFTTSGFSKACLATNTYCLKKDSAKRG